MGHRRNAFFEAIGSLREKEVISIKDLDGLMDSADKLLMEFDRVEKSRDKWRKKYEELKKND